MLYALIVVAAGLLVGADDAQKDEPPAGAWVVSALTHGGNDDANAKDSTVTFADGKMTIKETGGKEHRGTYTLDTNKKPATIDVVPADGPETGMTMKGVFALEKAELKLCLARPGKDRPTTLNSKAGEETMLVVPKK